MIHLLCLFVVFAFYKIKKHVENDTFYRAYLFRSSKRDGSKKYGLVALYNKQ